MKAWINQEEEEDNLTAGGTMDFQNLVTDRGVKSFGYTIDIDNRLVIYSIFNHSEFASECLGEIKARLEQKQFKFINAQ